MMSTTDDGFPIVLESNEMTFEAEFGEKFNYNQASNKPRINSVELVGLKTATDFGLQETLDTITPSDIDDILFRIEGDA